MESNRQYKSSVFALLFGNEAAARELFEALEGVTLPPEVPVTMNSLEGALFRKSLFKNVASRTVDIVFEQALS
jgi:hypothetical protein